MHIFMGSLLSIPLHRLELISFSAPPGNKCCHGNTFFLFLGLTNIFMCSLLSIPLHRLVLISFWATPGNKCCHDNTFCFLGLKIFLGVLYMPNPCTHWSHGNTFFLFLGCGYNKRRVPVNGHCVS